MDASGSKSGLVGLLRGTRGLPELPGRMRRPAVFALLFWCVLAFTSASYAFGPHPEGAGFGFLPVALGVAALAAAWLALPWDSRAGRRRKLAAPAFLACALGVGILTGSVWTMGLYAVSLANGVLLFGFGRGIAFAAAVLPVVFANYLLLLAELSPGRNLVPDALLLTAAWVPVAAFVIGVCAAIAEAVRRREEAQGLLAELGTAHSELAAAHAELGRHAERARELAVAEERARMAREIHDSVGHHLTVVNLQLQNALRLEERRPEQAWEQVKEAKRFTLEALSEVRRSVRALKPLALEERGGAGALAALARSFRGSGPEVRFVVEGEERGLPEGVALALYRALQEGLTNAIRHSGARRVTGTLSFGEERVRLRVADDGAGTPGGARGPGRTLGGGFGLAALRERAEALGGAARFGNAEGGGFVLDVELPMSEPPGGLPDGNTGRDGASS